ncbi:MAG TPA: hypothetical protein VN174_01140 [Candidatus Methanoperedens sp.]|nr:hypothetical protein [Candidatus Methanoperedens sp.]
MEKIVKIALIVFLFLNVLAIDIFLYLFWNKENFMSMVQGDSCPAKCEEMIKNELTNITPAMVTLVPTKVISPSSTAKIVQRNSIQKTRSTQYIPIPGTGSTLDNVWTDLPGTEFYISTDDYSGLVGSYFEANMKLLNGNGLAYLRLFDVTAGIEVWGSEVSTNSQSFTSVSSGKLTLRSGNHLYRVQAKSLTADTTVFNSGRIKVILEN